MLCWPLLVHCWKYGVSIVNRFARIALQIARATKARSDGDFVDSKLSGSGSSSSWKDVLSTLLTAVAGQVEQLGAMQLELAAYASARLAREQSLIGDMSKELEEVADLVTSALKRGVPRTLAFAFGFAFTFDMGLSSSRQDLPPPLGRPKFRPWSEFSLPRNSDHGLSFSFPQ